MSWDLKNDVDIVDAFTELYMGIGVKKNHVKQALKICGLEEKEFDNFDFHDTKEFFQSWQTVRIIKTPNKGTKTVQERNKEIWILGRMR